jgi:Metallopeptidase toxin 3
MSHPIQIQTNSKPTYPFGNLSAHQLMHIPSKTVWSLSIEQEEVLSKMVKYTQNIKYPFGMHMPGRSISSGSYRYGFGGHEKLDEVQGLENFVDMGDRWLDVRLGRTSKPDRRVNDFPGESPYNYAGSNPIYYIDVNGEFKFSADNEAVYRKKYPMIMKYLETQVKQDVMNSTIILSAFTKVTEGNLTKEKVETMVTWGKGPEIRFVDEPTWPFSGGKGHYEPFGDYIELREDDAIALENLLASDATDEEKLAAFLPWYKTLLHEGAHWGDYVNYEKVTSTPEIGKDFENEVWGIEGLYDPYFDDMYDKETATEVIEEKKKSEEGSKTLPTIPNE